MVSQKLPVRAPKTRSTPIPVPAAAAAHPTPAPHALEHPVPAYPSSYTGSVMSSLTSSESSLSSSSSSSTSSLSSSSSDSSISLQANGLQPRIPKEPKAPVNIWRSNENPLLSLYGVEMARDLPDDREV